MLCYPSVNLKTDIPYWVTKESFLQRFSQEDFNRWRKVKDVEDSYLAKWFCHSESDRSRFFCLPTVQVLSRLRTEFIDGRHRTAILLRHMPRVPLALARNPCCDQADFSEWIDSATDEPIELDSPIELPDLPIRSELP